MSCATCCDTWCRAPSFTQAVRQSSMHTHECAACCGCCACCCCCCCSQACSSCRAGGAHDLKRSRVLVAHDSFSLLVRPVDDPCAQGSSSRRCHCVGGAAESQHWHNQAGDKTWVPQATMCNSDSHTIRTTTATTQTQPRHSPTVHAPGTATCLQSLLPSSAVSCSSCTALRQGREAPTGCNQ